MRRPKGFGKNYFTLAAIQATVVQHRLDVTSVRIAESHLTLNTKDQESTEEELLDELLLSSAPALPTHAGHCNCYYSRITRNRIRHNSIPRLPNHTYLYTNSVTSPPFSPFIT